MSFSITGNLTNPEQPRVPDSIHDVYFAWLYDQVMDVWDVNSEESYTAVCALMHQVIFTALVPYDENRIADAAGLRNNFKELAGNIGPRELADLMLPDASVFEVLIALADRADFMVPLTRKVWFHIFLENLKLDKYNDWYNRPRSTWPVERIINVFNSRAYQPNGRGGIFPLRRAPQDQRKVELWYQMGAYMTDNSMY